MSVLQALQEAAKHLAKSRSTDREAQVATLQESCERMGRFVQAQACLAQDPATAVAICQQLLQEAPQHVVSSGGFAAAAAADTGMPCTAGACCDMHTREAAGVAAKKSTRRPPY
jgi:hypothetical protein